MVPLARLENKGCKEKRELTDLLVQQGGLVCREHVVSKEIGDKMAHQVHRVYAVLTVYLDSPVPQEM